MLPQRLHIFQCSVSSYSHFVKSCPSEGILSDSSSPHTSHIRLCVPSAVHVGSVTVAHSPQVCPVASISRLSVVASHLVQCLDSLPLVSQSGAKSTVYFSSKSCPSAGILSVSSSPHTSHIRLHVPSAVHVGSITVSHSPQVCPSASISRLSVVASHLVQCLDSLPFVTQSGATSLPYIPLRNSARAQVYYPFHRLRTCRICVCAFPLPYR